MDSDSKQFRRQLAATVVGALLGILGSCSVTSFQWAKQSQERARQERVEAMTQFAAALPHLMGGQFALWHLANRFNVIATRATRLAGKAPDFNKQEAIQQYNELIKDAWALLSDYSAAAVEFSKNNSAVSAAYYKLLAAFPNLALDIDWPLAENFQVLGLMPEQPESESLRQLATSFTTWSTSLKTSAEETGKKVNQWNSRLTELRRELLQK